MQKKKFHPFPSYSNRSIFIGALLLSIFGLFMIATAEMSRKAGQSSVIISSFIKQTAYIIGGVFLMGMAARFPLHGLRKDTLDKIYYLFIALLFLPRLQASAGGAYAWVRLGPVTIQPSEFAKVFMIIYISSVMSKNEGMEANIKKYGEMMLKNLIMFFIILLVEHDFGSAIVLFGINYIVLMISNLPGTSKCRSLTYGLFIFVIIVSLIVLSPLGTAFIKSLGINDYRLNRFLSSANPFEDQYDSGYHLVLSLVSIAQGGLFGVGYGNSIHKFMNFPNPSSDFIFAVIMEELGVVFGLLPLIILYFMILKPLVSYSLKVNDSQSRMIIVGSFMYFILHIIFNIGGVSGLIPLTGVPLLIVSSGGSSLWASMMSLGFAQSEIIRYERAIKCLE